MSREAKAWSREIKILKHRSNASMCATPSMSVGFRCGILDWLGEDTGTQERSAWRCADNVKSHLVGRLKWHFRKQFSEVRSSLSVATWPDCRAFTSRLTLYYDTIGNLRTSGRGVRSLSQFSSLAPQYCVQLLILKLQPWPKAAGCSQFVPSGRIISAYSLVYLKYRDHATYSQTTVGAHADTSLVRAAEEPLSEPRHALSPEQLRLYVVYNVYIYIKFIVWTHMYMPRHISLHYIILPDRFSCTT